MANRFSGVAKYDSSMFHLTYNLNPRLVRPIVMARARPGGGGGSS